MRYSFAECVLDTETYRLQRDGRDVAVEPQVFDLLKLLAENAGRLVTKDALVDAIWGGRAVSDATISARISAARAAVGDTGERQAVIRTLVRRGIELAVPVTVLDERAAPDPEPVPDRPDDAAPAPVPAGRQRLRYTASADGTQIAWATSGAGPPMLWAGPHITHLEVNWQSPIWRRMFDLYGASHTLVRFDIRGAGLSGASADYGIERHVEDMAAVVEAAGLDRFPMVASLQATAVAIRYIAENPGRVTRLAIQCGYVRGRALREGAPPDQAADPSIALLKEGWGDPANGYMRAWLSMFLPSATSEELTDLIRQIGAACPAEEIAENRKAIDRFMAADCLDRVDIPTLVVHPRGSVGHPLAEAQLIAAGIPGAEFLVVEGANVICLPSDPTWDDQMGAILEFLGED